MLRRFTFIISLVVISPILTEISMGEEARIVPTSAFEVPDDLEVTVWARSPQLFNPTNMDTDRHGRIWVAEGVNYRRNHSRPEGDRIVVLEDTNRDGQADRSHTFVQDPELVSPLGVSVFDNRIVVAQPPHILVYTDVDRDLKFDPAIDTREELLSGFNGKNHDHSLHPTMGGPDGKWYFNQGNCGAQITDKDGNIFQSGGPYYKKGGGTPEWFNDTRSYAGKPSSDGNVYQGGFAGKMNPDASGIQIIGHGFRNSYELCISSFGDVFQNDNDDPPACRNTWLMEGGNLGFFSADGTRTWKADRRPGQTTAIAHWRQEDPGTLPAGDVYGAGSPTGMVLYEHGALPDKYEGMLLSCEARARVIQSYFPRLSKSGAAMELGARGTLLACPDNTMFRPSDIMVGADGALYLSDWFDPGVGGHRARDESFSGAIYRIAPKGFVPEIPKLIQDPLLDAAALLKSPAANVRFVGFEKLKEAGSSALPVVNSLLESPVRWHVARAVWLLPFLGDQGINAWRERLIHADPEQRLLAFRSLRNAGHDIIELAQKCIPDASLAVKREIAVALRDVDGDSKFPYVVELFGGVDGKDRHYLEACGLAAEDIESRVWTALRGKAHENPIQWSEGFVRSTWRLKPSEAVPELIRRAESEILSVDERILAVDSLAFTGTEEAVSAIVGLAGQPGDLGLHARWWVLNRGRDDWAHMGVLNILKDKGIYDAEKVVLSSIVVPPAPATQFPEPNELMKMKGESEAGKLVAARCRICHVVDGDGVDFGPALDGWIADQGLEAFYEAVIFPSRSIAHGFYGSTIFLKGGGQIEGLVYGENDPLIIVSTGGIQQLVPRQRIAKFVRRNKNSLMLSADQLGMNPQDLVNLGAYLSTR